MDRYREFIDIAKEVRRLLTAMRPQLETNSFLTVNKYIGPSLISLSYKDATNHINVLTKDLRHNNTSNRATRF